MIEWYEYTKRRRFRPVVSDFAFILALLLAGVVGISALLTFRETGQLSLRVLVPLIYLLPLVVCGVALFLIYERMPTSNIGLSEHGLHFGMRPFGVAQVGWERLAEARVVPIEGVDPAFPDERPTWYAIYMPGLTVLHAIVGLQMAMVTQSEPMPAFVITHHHKRYPQLVARLRIEIEERQHHG